MLYAVEALGLDLVKIGWVKSDATLGARWDSYRTCCPTDVVLLGVSPGDQDSEKATHQMLAYARVKGEWFRKSLVWPEVGASFATWVSPVKCKGCGEGFSLSAMANRGKAARNHVELCGGCSRKQNPRRQKLPRVCVSCKGPVSDSVRVNQVEAVRKGKTPHCRACLPKDHYEAWWKAGVASRQKPI